MSEGAEAGVEPGPGRQEIEQKIWQSIWRVRGINFDFGFCFRRFRFLVFGFLVFEFRRCPPQGLI